MAPRTARAMPTKRTAGVRAKRARASSAKETDDDARADDGRDARAPKRRQPDDALPGLPVDVVVKHVLGDDTLPDPADLARLRAVSRGMRDAVAQTGRPVEPRELLRSMVMQGSTSSSKRSARTLPNCDLYDGDDPLAVARAYVEKHRLDPSHARHMADYLVKQETVKPVNRWFPVEPDDPNAFHPIRDADSAEASREAFSKYYLDAAFKKVKWGDEEVFLYKGKKGGINGSPHFFCGKCAGIWVSHDYPPNPDPDAPSRALYRLVRSGCKFCGSETFQERVLFSTGL